MQIIRRNNVVLCMKEIFHREIFFLCKLDFYFHATLRHPILSETQAFHAKTPDCLIVPTYESNGIFVLGVGFFLQTNFDFLTSHF